MLKTNDPGPGTFNPSVVFVRDRSPSPIIGTGPREGVDSRRHYPGIGEYDLRAKKTDGPSFM